jgi:hypothetical protein
LLSWGQIFHPGKKALYNFLEPETISDLLGLSLEEEEEGKKGSK